MWTWRLGKTAAPCRRFRNPSSKHCRSCASEGFDVSVCGRALDDEGVVSLDESVRLDVVPNTRVLSVLALREAGREVGEAGLLAAADKGDVALCTLYLDAGVPMDCTDDCRKTPLHHACRNGQLSLAALLLDRGSRAIDEKNGAQETPLHHACFFGHLWRTRHPANGWGTAVNSP